MPPAFKSLGVLAGFRITLEQTEITVTARKLFYSPRACLMVLEWLHDVYRLTALQMEKYCAVVPLRALWVMEFWESVLNLGSCLRDL